MRNICRKQWLFHNTVFWPRFNHLTARRFRALGCKDPVVFAEITVQLFGIWNDQKRMDGQLVKAKFYTELNLAE